MFFAVVVLLLALLGAAPSVVHGQNCQLTLDGYTYDVSALYGDYYVRSIFNTPETN